MAEIKGKKYTESLLLRDECYARIMISAGENFDPGSDTRLHYLELLCSKVLLKYNRDR